MTVFLLLAIGQPGAVRREAGAEDFPQVEVHWLLELIEGTRLRRPVRAPADELGGVPQPRAFHVVIADLQHALGAQRCERQVLSHVPPAVFGAARRSRPLRLLSPGGATPRTPRIVSGPVPRVALERR